MNTFKDLIHLFPDRFDYYHGLFSAVQISREGGYSSSDTDESLIKFINSIKSEEKIRGPALSKLLLGKILGYKGTFAMLALAPFSFCFKLLLS